MITKRTTFALALLPLISVTGSPYFPPHTSREPCAEPGILTKMYLSVFPPDPHSFLGCDPPLLDKVESTSCQAGFNSAGIIIQASLDEDGEGEMESIALFKEVSVTPLNVQEGSISWRSAAEDNPKLMYNLLKQSKRTVEMLVGLKLISEERSLEYSSCILEAIMSNIQLIVVTAGQELIPVVMAEIGVWSCNKTTCTPYRHHLPEDPKNVQRVIRLDDAMLAGKIKAISYTIERQKKKDLDLWEDAKQEVKLMGDFCTKNKEGGSDVPQMAYTREGKIMQINAKMDQIDCQCQYYCMLWRFSSIVPNDWFPCATNVLYKGDGTDLTCPGAWWRFLEDHATKPKMYNYDRNTKTCHNGGPSIDISGEHGNRLLAPKKYIHRLPGGLDFHPKVTQCSFRKFWFDDLQFIFSFGAHTEYLTIPHCIHSDQFVSSVEISVDEKKDIGIERVRELKKQIIEIYDEKSSFPNIFTYPDAIRKSNFVYIDADFQSDQLGTHVLANGNENNDYWQIFYKTAMYRSKIMIFLIDDAWLPSLNCWEELAWAQNKQLNAQAKEKGFLQIEDMVYTEYTCGLNKLNARTHNNIKIQESDPCLLDAEAKTTIFAYIGQNTYDVHHRKNDDGVESLNVYHAEIKQNWSMDIKIPGKKVDIVCETLYRSDLVSSPKFQNNLECILKTLDELKNYTPVDKLSHLATHTQGTEDDGVP